MFGIGYNSHTVSAIVAVSAFCASGAFAQLNQVEPYYVVATEKLSLRCGEGELFYRVGEVPAGTMLLLDGESTAWSRIMYPTGVHAYIRAEEVDEVGASTLKIKPSKLKAVNLATGWSGSWKALLATPLPSGTSLKLIEPVRDGDTGPIVGYKVHAPEQARAFVESRAVRKATDAEVQQFKTKGTATATPSVTAAPVTPPQPASQPPTATNATSSQVNPPASANTAVATPATSTPPQPVAATPVDMTKPVAAPAPGTPATTATPPTPPASPAATPATPAGSSVPPQPAAVPPDAPATIEQVTIPVPQASPTEPVPDQQAQAPVVVNNDPRPGAVAYDLEPTFQAVIRQPLMTAEMDELYAEYGRAIDTLEDGSRMKRQLMMRRDALQLRIDMRDRQRLLEEQKAAIDAGRGAVNEQISLAEQARVYTMIGQLQPSTVYDGKQLPLMYRVLSVGGSSPRTLGYLKAENEQAMLGKIGAVVGVIGEAQIDRSLMLNVITPVRVDVLKPKSEVEATPGTAPQ